ncbi:hypothetical protein llap_16359 [Limosa lapponica baueri]|uniref:Uncharacterized protein n=1 Tax=Limosa lapponica baueri TaxID=1758121 RepID=A0A2I0THP1_LIMLA|nr:hypothetical protein llap_16359 [Limosa lapponica baueri]
MSIVYCKFFSPCLMNAYPGNLEQRPSEHSLAWKFPDVLLKIEADLNDNPKVLCHQFSHLHQFTGEKIALGFLAWSYVDELGGALSQEGFGQELDLPAAVRYMRTMGSEDMQGMFGVFWSFCVYGES